MLEVVGAELDGLVIVFHAMGPMTPHSTLSTKTTHFVKDPSDVPCEESHCTYQDFLSQTVLDLGNVQV